jgi:hypothetical protein
MERRSRVVAFATRTCCVVLLAAIPACAAPERATRSVQDPGAAGADQCIALVRRITLPGVEGPVDRNGIAGRLDHLAYDPVTDRLFLAAFSKGSLEVVERGTGTLVRSIGGIPEAQGVAVVPALHRVFVSCGDDGTLRAFDTLSLESLGAVAVAEDADNVRFDERTGSVMVGGGSKSGGAVVAVDPVSLAKRCVCPVLSHAESFQCDPSGPRVFVNVPGDKYAEDEGAVAVLDRDACAPITTWPVHRAARNFPMALDAAHGRLYVATRKPAGVHVMDTASGSVLASADCAADCDDVFLDSAGERLLVIGGGRRTMDRAGPTVESDRPGALDVFSVARDGIPRRIAVLPLPPHARTGLWVPSLRTLFVAVPVQGREPAELREYLLRP